MRGLHANESVAVWGAVKLLEERVEPTLPLVDWARDSHKMERCNAAPCTKTAKRAERDTAGNVKLVLPPRQSRGYSHFVIDQASVRRRGLASANPKVLNMA